MITVMVLAVITTIIQAGNAFCDESEDCDVVLPDIRTGYRNISHHHGQLVGES